MLTLFCTGGKGVTTETAEGQNDVLQQALSSILEDLSECLVRGETGTLVYPRALFRFTFFFFFWFLWLWPVSSPRDIY